MPPIRHVTVLGAGTMGAQIAAHLANAGVPVLLLDLTADAARKGLDRARKLKPDPFFLPDGAKLIETGSFDDLSGLTASDWIIEAIVEDLDVKRQLLARVDAPGGPRDRLVEHVGDSHRGARRRPVGRLPAALARHPLLQSAALPAARRADPDAGHRSGSDGRPVGDFIDRRLGKGVVVAKDTPAFIANHIGLFGVVRLLEAVASGDYTIEEIDALTGPAIGRPKSATFRTLDIAGLDILAHVTRDLARRLPNEDDRRRFELPPFVDAMIARGLLGEKTGQGFYKRVKDGGETKILTLDLRDARISRMRREPARAAPPSLDAAKSITDTGERHPHAVSRARTTSGRCSARRRGPDAALRRARRARHRALDRRRGSRDAVGVSAGSWGRSRRGDAIGPGRPSRRMAESPGAPQGQKAPEVFRIRRRVVKRNPGASLVDLGDGVLVRRVPLEDEHHRRRRDRDAARRRQGSRREFRGARRRQRSARTSRPART